MPEVRAAVQCEFGELVGKTYLHTRRGFPDHKWWNLRSVQQLLNLKLDHKGALVEAVFKVPADFTSIAGEEHPPKNQAPAPPAPLPIYPKRLLFNRPFLMTLWRTNADYPYLAFWIAGDGGNASQVVLHSWNQAIRCKATPPPHVHCRMRTLSLWFALGITLTTQAANWPAWRGPHHDGTCDETGLPRSGVATENIAWKAELPDRGNSTPVIWGDKLFITQCIESEGRRELWCFDKKTGKPLWKSGITFQDAEPTHATNPHCSASPATDGDGRDRLLRDVRACIAMTWKAKKCGSAISAPSIIFGAVARRQSSWATPASSITAPARMPRSTPSIRRPESLSGSTQSRFAPTQKKAKLASTAPGVIRFPAS